MEHWDQPHTFWAYRLFRLAYLASIFDFSLKVMFVPLSNSGHPDWQNSMIKKKRSRKSTLNTIHPNTGTGSSCIVSWHPRRIFITILLKGGTPHWAIGQSWTQWEQQIGGMCLSRTLQSLVSSFIQRNCKTLPIHLPEADCPIFTLSSVGRRRSVVVVKFCYH